MLINKGQKRLPSTVIGYLRHRIRLMTLSTKLLGSLCLPRALSCPTPFSRSDRWPYHDEREQIERLFPEARWGSQTGLAEIDLSSSHHISARNLELESKTRLPNFGHWGYYFMWFWIMSPSHRHLRLTIRLLRKQYPSCSPAPLLEGAQTWKAQPYRSKPASVKNVDH